MSPSSAMSRDTEAVEWSLFEDESTIPAAAEETWQLKDACQILLDRIDQNCPFCEPGLHSPQLSRAWATSRFLYSRNIKCSLFLHMGYGLFWCNQCCIGFFHFCNSWFDLSSPFKDDSPCIFLNLESTLLSSILLTAAEILALLRLQLPAVCRLFRHLQLKGRLQCHSTLLRPWICNNNNKTNNKR